MSTKDSRKDRFKEWLGDESPIETSSSNNNNGGMGMFDPLLRPILDYDETIQFIGTCTKLEKDYFRLQSLPNPSEVRPLSILKQAFEHITTKYGTSIKDYTWFGSQFRAIRQDLILQHINDDFTILVYETNSRVSLHNDDYFQLSQCLTHLHHLYQHYTQVWYSLTPKQQEKRGLDKHPDIICKHKEEFIMYRILVSLLTSKNDNSLTQDLVLQSLTYNDLTLPGVKYALAVQKCLLTKNFNQFFKLYHSSPYLSKLILKDALLNLRRTALHTLLHSNRPNIDYLQCAIYLGFIPSYWIEYNLLLLPTNLKYTLIADTTSTTPATTSTTSTKSSPTTIYDYYRQLTLPQEQRYAQLYLLSEERISTDQKLKLFDQQPTFDTIQSCLDEFELFLNEHLVTSEFYTTCEIKSIQQQLIKDNNNNNNSSTTTKKGKKIKKASVFEIAEFGDDNNTTIMNQQQTKESEQNQLKIGTTTSPIGWFGIEHDIVIHNLGTLSCEQALPSFINWQRDHNQSIKVKTAKQLTDDNTTSTTTSNPISITTKAKKQQSNIDTPPITSNNDKNVKKRIMNESAQVSPQINPVQTTTNKKSKANSTNTNTNNNNINDSLLGPPLNQSSSSKNVYTTPSNQPPFQLPPHHHHHQQQPFPPHLPPPHQQFIPPNHPNHPPNHPQQFPPNHPQYPNYNPQQPPPHPSLLPPPHPSNQFNNLPPNQLNPNQNPFNQQQFPPHHPQHQPPFPPHHPQYQQPQFPQPHHPMHPPQQHPNLQNPNQNPMMGHLPPQYYNNPNNNNQPMDQAQWARYQQQQQLNPNLPPNQLNPNLPPNQHHLPPPPPTNSYYPPPTQFPSQYYRQPNPQQPPPPPFQQQPLPHPQQPPPHPQQPPNYPNPNQPNPNQQQNQPNNSINDKSLINNDYDTSAASGYSSNNNPQPSQQSQQQRPPQSNYPPNSNSTTPNSSFPQPPFPPNSTNTTNIPPNLPPNNITPPQQQSQQAPPPPPTSKATFDFDALADPNQPSIRPQPPYQQSRHQQQQQQQQGPYGNMQVTSHTNYQVFPTHQQMQQPPQNRQPPPYFQNNNNMPMNPNINQFPSHQFNQYNSTPTNYNTGDEWNTWSNNNQSHNNNSSNNNNLPPNFIPPAPPT